MALNARAGLPLPQRFRQSFKSRDDFTKCFRPQDHGLDAHTAHLGDVNTFAEPQPVAGELSALQQVSSVGRWLPIYGAGGSIQRD